MKYILMLAIVMMSLVSCRHLPPGHDPHGPGNSENAPGQIKKQGY